MVWKIRFALLLPAPGEKCQPDADPSMNFFSPEPDGSPPPDSATPPMWRLRDLAVGLGLLLLWRLLSLIPREWLAGVPASQFVAVTGILSQMCLLAYPLVIARRRRMADQFRWPGFERFVFEAALAIPIVIGLFLMLLCAGLIITRVAPHTSLTPAVFERAASAQDYSFVMVIAVLAVLVAPVCEEVFFRGFLYSALRSRLPVPVAALVQSLIFALLHTFGTLHGVAVFFLGLILTAVYEWRKSLVTPIFVHAGNNLMAVLGLLLLMYVTANSPVLGVIGRDHPEGVNVDEVVADSAAAKAGIAAGDIVTDINGEKIARFTNLVEILRQHQAGDQVTVGINRHGEHLTFDVVLDKRPPPAH
jgi:membrane protease YdiL (CAAX protease family)